MSEPLKHPATGRLIKLLDHTRSDRGMTLIPEQSRCVQRDQIHELVLTDQRGLAPEGRVDHVGFLGFAVFTRPGVVEAGDELWVDGRKLGVVVGFDACHFPNHYNIIVQGAPVASGVELQLRIGDPVVFQPPRAVESNAPTVLAGFGRAGKGLHLPCVRQARAQAFGAAASEQVFVFDPYLDRSADDRAALRHCTWIDSLDAIPRPLREQAIFHVCTPPRIRSELVASATKLGIRRFVLEKPMAGSPAELQALAELNRQHQLEIFVVSNWLVSGLTIELDRRLRDRPDVKFKAITMHQRKSRIMRSRENLSHDTAFDVEVPHMLGLAFRLCGPDLTLTESLSWDLVVDGETVSGMGGSRITLETAQGQVITLNADHMSPLRQRSILVELDDGGRYEGYFPCTSADLYSQLLVHDRSGAPPERTFIKDDTMTRFFVEVYRWFAGSGSRPFSDFEFNVGVCTLLHAAKHRSRQVAP